MATFRGISQCDRCGEPSKLYQPWAVCRECNKDVCLVCREPHTTIEYDLDQPETAICLDCAAFDDQEPGGTVEDAQGQDRL